MMNAWPLAFCLLTSVAVAAEFKTPGKILVAKATGSATLSVGGSTTPVDKEQSVPSGATLRTARNAILILAFSNGTNVRLESEAELIVEEFLQDPFSGLVSTATTEEPSPSRTRLKFIRGEVVVEVKKLRFGQGSAFAIATPAGVVGIRGTTFRLAYQPPANASQKNEMTISVTEGMVSFVSRDGSIPELIPQGRSVSVPVK